MDGVFDKDEVALWYQYAEHCWHGYSVHALNLSLHHCMKTQQSQNESSQANLGYCLHNVQCCCPWRVHTSDLLKTQFCCPANQLIQPSPGSHHDATLCWIWLALYLS